MTSKPSIDIVIPVLNEERALPGTVATLREFLRDAIPNPWRIVIADNGSNDTTPQVCHALTEQYPEVAYLRIEQRGRGRALRKAWLDSDADVVSYMDVDLSTDLRAFPLLLQSLQDGHDIAIGARLIPGAEVHLRSLKRELISRSYNLLIKSMFFVPFQDAQCGFKALTRKTAQAIVPHIKNDNWFFDTELLIIAAKRGYKINSVPVKWDDDPTSTVHITSTATEDIKGLLRLRFGGIPKVPPPDTDSA